MKRYALGIARQAACIDRQAARIFALTSGFVSAALMLSLLFLCAQGRFDDPLAGRMAAEGLFSASLRMTALGTALGFAADMAAKRTER